MAETLVKNIESTELTNSIAYTNTPKVETDGLFSTLMTNASNKAEQTQTNFVDNIVKTNTSSINQYAINNENAQTQQQIQTTTKNQVQNQSKNAVQNQSKTNIQNQSKAQNTSNLQEGKSKNSQLNAKTSPKENTSANINQSDITKNNEIKNFAQNTTDTKFQVKTTSNNSDNKAQNINTGATSDPLEPSPVSNNVINSATDEYKGQISSDNDASDIKTEIENEIKTIVENILLTFDIPVSNTQDTETDTTVLFNSSDVSQDEGENIIKAIDEISSQIEDMDLAQNKKDDILIALQKVQDGAQKIQDTIKFNEAINEAKNIIDETIVQRASVVHEENMVQQEPVSETATETVKQNVDLSVDKNNELNETIKLIKDAIAQVAKEAENQDAKAVKTTEIKIDTDKLKEIVKDLETEIQNTENVDAKDLKEKLVSNLKSLIESVENLDSGNTEDKIVQIEKLVKDLEKEVNKDEAPKVELPKIDHSKDIKITEKMPVHSEEIKKTDDAKEQKITVAQKDNLDTQDTKQKNDVISEMVSALKDFEKSEEYISLNDEEKQRVQEIVRTLVTFEKDDNVSEKQNPKELLEEIKKEISSVLNNEAVDTENNTSDTEEVSNQIAVNSKDTNSNNTNFEQQNQKSDNRAYEKTATHQVKKDAYQQIDKNNVKVENKTQSQEEINTDIDINENEPVQNPSKPTGPSINLVKELKEDFLEDARYSNQSQGALTVADEVAKIALDKNNTLTSQTPVGNVTYDPANSAVQIKNVQNIVQPQVKEAPQSSILNQIGDKLYQLKDSQKLTLILRPDDLGRLSIELTSDKNGLTTNIIAQNEHVRKYIEKNIQTLRAQLSEQGVNVNTIQIRTAGQDNSTTYEGNQNKEFQQEQNKQNNQKQQQNNQKQQKEELAQLQNYDMHFAKDFSGILNKTLSYIN